MPPESHVKIHWGKVATIEELEGDAEGSKDDWSASVIVYGIIGILELYNGAVTFCCHFVLVTQARIPFDSIIPAGHPFQISYRTL